MAAVSSKSFERFFLARRNRQYPVEARNVENFLDDLVETANLQFPIDGLEALGGDQKDAKTGTADIVELLEVHKDLRCTFLD